MALGENIKRIRTKSTKYSQQDMADFLGVDRNTYANWERGENDIKSEFIPKLAELFGVNIEDLFSSDKSTNVSITQQHNEGKDNSILNGAIIVITDKDAVYKLAEVIQENIKKQDN
ncbi:MAG: helix-turn-helix transcriptional regulator [Crocinitomicaceae bacterium]|nr:helix-turn-helix transcriptional regulator [Crocinitomicaceae bacterium]